MLLIWKISYLKILHIQQKKAIRAILGVPFDSPSTPLFCNLGILNLNQLLTYHTSIFMYQQQNGLLPNTLLSLFNSNSFYHLYNTRNAANLSTPFYTLSISCHNVIYKGVSIWNSLPRNIKNCTSLNLFKRKLKSYLLGKHL